MQDQERLVGFRRLGFTEWRPESLIAIGGGFVVLLVSEYYVAQYLP